MLVAPPGGLLTHVSLEPAAHGLSINRGNRPADG